MDYFITGLPRSKTAWASLYFSRGNYVCHHELIAQHGVNACLNFEPSVGIMEGNSDAGLIILFEEFLKRFPVSPWINIIRSDEDVLKSGIKYGIALPNIRFAIKRQKQFREAMEGNPEYLEIPFDFTDLELEEACEHIGIEYSQSHTDRMRKYNIQLSEYHKKKMMMLNNVDSL